MKQMRLMIAGAVIAAVTALTVYSVAAVQRRCEILLRDADAVAIAAEQGTAVGAAIAALERDWAAFICLYLSFSPLLFASLLCTAICKASSDSHFGFFHFFFLGMILLPVSCTMSKPPSIVHQALYQI